MRKRLRLLNWAAVPAIAVLTGTVLAATAIGASANGVPDPGAKQQANPAVTSLVQQVLTNEATNGWGNLPGVNNGLGTLWTNWLTGSNPLTTNWSDNGYECAVTNGVPDCSVSSPKTDPHVDERFLHTLLLYKHQHPGDHRYDPTIRKWTAIFKAEWAKPEDQRGWTYDELADMYRLTSDHWYIDQAHYLADWYRTANYHASCGCLYLTDSTHSDGEYRPIDMMPEATAMVQEGMRTSDRAMVAAGRSAYKFIVTHAWLKGYNVPTYWLQDVFNPDGTVNPDENFYSGNGVPGVGGQVEGNQIHSMDGFAIVIQDSLHAYEVTRDPLYRSTADQLLTSFSPQVNSIGAWDPTYGGWCRNVDFSGASVDDPGAATVLCDYKEVGRQIGMLDAYHLADTVAGGHWQQDEAILTKLAIGPMYYAAGQGYLYRSNPDFSPFVYHGTAETWVTTEADGIALEALLAVSDDRPW